MADDITIRAKVELDVDRSQTEQIQQKVNEVKAKIPVSIDGKDIQQSVQSAINKTKIQNPIRIPVEIDSSGMKERFISVNKQIENYVKKIEAAQGVIKNMRLTPINFESEDSNGNFYSGSAYQAIIDYQTAIGETIQRTVVLSQDAEILADSVDQLSVNFAKQRKESDALVASIAKYQQQLEALKGKASGFLGENISDDDSFKRLVNSISFDNIGDPAQLQQMVNLLHQAQEQYKALNASITNNKMGDSAQIMQAKLEQIPVAIERIQAKFAGFTIPDNIAAQIEHVNELLAKVNTAETNETRNAAYNELISIMNTLSGATDNAINKQKMLNAELANQQKAQDKLNSLIARYKASGQRYSAFKSDSGLVSEYQTLGKTIEELQARLDRVKATGVWDKSITADIASANAQMSQFNNHVVAAGKNTKSIKDRFKEAFSTFGTWLSATGLMMRAIQGFKQAVAAVKDIDAAMTNLKKVTNETSEAYNQYLKNVGKQAQQIGSSMSDLIESASTFAKLGYSFKEAQGLSEVATIFANVGDFSNIGTATNGLITAMKSFHITADEAMLIADRINEVANNYAVSADDLTTGLTHSASALSLAGNSIDETIAMITAMSEITQNASESGNALKILSMRLRGAKADLESAGESTDGMCESASKLREQIKALTGGVDIMADEAGTQFKSTYQIMKEISGVWEGMSDINQAALLETIAGKLRGNSISALLTNMAQAEKVLKTSLNSAGSAMEEHSKWMDSIEAKGQKMKAAWQDFADSFVQTDAVKGWYDALTGILNVLTQIIDKVGLLPTLLGVAYGGMAMRGNGLFGTATNSNGETVGRIGKYVMGSGGFSLGALFNGVADQGIIDQYTEALNRGATAAEAMKAAVTDASGEIMNLNGATRSALAGLNGGARAMQQLGISTAATTAKTIAQTVATKALNAALNIGIMALVSLVATGIAKGIEWLSNEIDKDINKVKYLNQDIESIEQKYAELNNEISSVNSELETTQKRIAELQGKDSLSFIEKGELERLKETNRELERRITNLKEQANIAQADKRRKLDEKFIEEYTKENLDKSEYTKSQEAAAYSKKSLQEKIQAFNEMPLESRTSYLGEETVIIADTGSKVTGKEKISEYLRIYTELDKKKKESVALSEDEEKAYKEAKKYLVDQYEYLHSYLDDYGDYEGGYTSSIRGMIENIGRTLYPDTFKQGDFEKITGLDQYKQSVTQIRKLSEQGLLTEETLSQFPELSSALTNAGFSVQEIVEQFNSMVAAEEKVIETTSSLSTIKEVLTNLLNAQNTVAEVLKDQGFDSSITIEQYKKLVEAGQEYADCVENVNGYMQLNIDKVNKLIAANYEAEQSDLAMSKAAAKQKYKDNVEEIESLRLALSLVNSESEEALKIQSKIDQLQNDNSGILSEIQGYDRLASQIEYATSAYKKWLDAQNSPEAGDAYDNMKTALKQLKEGQESGKIGTVKYKAALDLLVPEGQDAKKYTKKLERYFTDDATGLNNFIDDMFSKGILSKDKNGTYKTKGKQTIEGIAKKLGLTNDVVQYMLEALKDYGADIDIKNEDYGDSEKLKDYQAAVKKTEEAQKALDKVMQDSTATDEQKKKAQDALTKAQQEQEKAAKEAGVKEEVKTKSPEEQLQEQIQKWQGAIASMEALEIPLSGMIAEYKNGEGVDPNTLVAALKAFVASYASAEGVDPNTLVSALGAYISSYTNGNGVDPASLLSTLGAVVTSYSNSGVDPNTLVSKLAAVISSFTNSADPNSLVGALAAVISSYDDGTLDPNSLVSALAAIIGGYTNGSGVNPNTLTSDLSAIISAYTNGQGVRPDALVSALTAYVTAIQNGEGVDPNTLVANLTATVQPTVNESDEASAHATMQGYFNSHPVQAKTTLAAPTPEEIAAYRKAVDQGLEEYDPEKYGGPQPGGSLTSEQVEALHDMNGVNPKPTPAPPKQTPAPPSSNNSSNNGQQTIDVANATINVDNSKEASQDKQENQVKPTPTPSAKVKPTPTPPANVVPAPAPAPATPTPAATPKPSPAPPNRSQQPVTVSVDANVDEARKKIDAMLKELQSNGGEYSAAKVKLGVTDEELQEALKTVQEADGQTVTITPEMSSEEAQAQLEKFLRDNSGQELTFGLNADPSSAISTADSTVENINKKHATILISGKYTGDNVPRLAKGTHNAKEEDAIVGEAGVETWIHNGQYVTVGHDGPELVHLTRGDQVLTASETKALFGNKKRVSGNAYAVGLNTKALVGGGAKTTTIATKKIPTKKKKTTTKKTSSVNTVKKYLDSLSDLVDWIPTLLDNLKKKTESYIHAAENAVGYLAKNSQLDKAIGNINTEIVKNQEGYNRYIKQANEIAANTKLSSSIISRIQDGTIDINSYDEQTRSAISAYQKWYDLAVKCKDAITDLKDQQYELAKQKLDNISKYYENRLTLASTKLENQQKKLEKKTAFGKEIVTGDYDGMIANLEKQIKYTASERNKLQRELDKLVSEGTIKEGSDDWYEYVNKIKELDGAIIDATISIEEFKDSQKNIVITNLQTALSAIEHIQSTVQGLMDFRSSQGKTAVAGDYKDLISASVKQVKNLEAQNKELKEQQKGLDILSEKYQEIQKQINDNEEAILSAKASQEEWNDAIIDLEIEKLQKQNEEYKNQLELMDAIEAYEKAKQRRALIYREGQGFNYESIEADVRAAQDTLDDILLDRQIKQLEDSKADNNLYDNFGNELVPISDTLSGFDLSNYYDSVLKNIEDSSLLASALGKLDISKLIAKGAATKELSVVIQSGAINLSGVNDVNALSEAITRQLPNELLQQLYK